jgi:hypothetical protein
MAKGIDMAVGIAVNVHGHAVQGKGQPGLALGH